jgi:hypothetical protein
MEIDQIINYHEKAAQFLENSIQQIGEQSEEARDDNQLRAFLAGADFHRQTIVVLIAAKKMFQEKQAAKPKVLSIKPNEK